MKFTKEEISLCKQVAERYKRFPRKGDWEYNDNTKEATLRKSEYSGMENPLSGEVNIFLLWTISDCLEFLKGRNYDCILYSNRSQLRWYLKFNVYPLVSSMEILNGGKTPLEVCLKAVLAVLEEEGK